MTCEELIATLKAQGFHYLTDAECAQLLNSAYLLDICEDEDFFFLEESAEGTAPLEVKDLRTIEYVTNVTQNNKLDPLRRARITDDFTPDIDQPGSPSVYYVTEGKNVNVFPTSTTDKILVRYWKVPEELSGTAEPLLPKRWHSLVVDGARARGYENSDDWELATAAEAKFNVRLERMRDSLGTQQHDAPDDYVVVEDPAALH
jgi:hypothetical protein